LDLSSEKSIPQKLFMKENYTVLLVNEPEEYNTKLGKLPKNVSLVSKPTGQVDFIQVFISSKSELESQLVRLKPFLKPQGLLWVTYPKGTSKKKTDVNRDVIREYAESTGLQAVALVAVDETWSALRLKISK
jgi:hypothetical protein